ncbi:MAG: sensor histidine kinase, partial [Lachnospiraceae bacterium]|nr:sensor histidine kinase [Lachnospiraceae bacterium]
MKSEKISIKWKIFIYLLSFLGILLILLWLFQTVYLDKFYKRIKEKELKNATENILSVINDEDLETAINTIADRYDICVLIADTD